MRQNQKIADLDSKRKAVVFVREETVFEGQRFKCELKACQLLHFALEKGQAWTVCR